jgi:hypothetical protein
MGPEASAFAALHNCRIGLTAGGLGGLGLCLLCLLCLLGGLGLLGRLPCGAGEGGGPGLPPGNTNPGYATASRVSLGCVTSP